jgi:valyl-tRNA synthetase
MYNIRDWCVSRQLWWGHRIPAWHCGGCAHVTVAREAPRSCPQCGSAELTQDPDVLDTWFSSGLWPFSTLGWPDETADLKTFYPTTLLITGFDILFFWVARMVMLGMEMMGDVPFRTVYIHGLVRDAERQKMSKTKGNTVDPLVVTEQYGTDAVRFALLRGAAPGTDIVLSEERMVSSRAFANKIWNAARFIFMQMEKVGVESLDLGETPPIVNVEDRWIFHRLNETTARINDAHENFRYHEVADLVWGFLWDEFCDWYVEVKKLRIQQGTNAREHLTNLLRVFEQALRLLHPVMPFLTEELWQRLVKRDTGTPESISIAAFPRANGGWQDETGARAFALLQQLVTEVRALRAEQKIDPKQQTEGAIRPASETAARLFSEQLPIIDALTNARLELAAEISGMVRSRPDFDVVLKLSDAQAGAERQRLTKDIEALRKVIEAKKKQLSSENFLGRAPAAVVEETRAKLAEQEAQLALSEQRLRQLGA